MIKTATVVSIKMPPNLLERIPAPGNGRSRFILSAVEEKLSRQQSPAWKPTTRRGKKLAKLLAAGKAERGAMMTAAEVEQEIRERRGRVF